MGNLLAVYTGVLTAILKKFKMSYVDEALLSKIIDKLGVDNQTNNATKTRLWAKVTKEYNSITGNTHTKARLSKKWQNIKAIRKQKRMKLMTDDDGQVALHESEDTSKIIEASEFGQAPKVYLYQDIGENMWNVMDYALRDLFLHLVRKYNVDETTNPRIKNDVWRAICKEFHEYVGDIVQIRHEKFTKKWQNWKQYNKSKNKPHPLSDESVTIDIDMINEKLRKLKERAALDVNFAHFLSRESDEIKTETMNVSTSKVVHLDAVKDSPMVSTASVSNVSNKQLEREVYLEALRCEQERFRTLVENGRLESDKLRREADFMDVQLQLAQAELALKKQECAEKGIILQ